MKINNLIIPFIIITTGIFLLSIRVANISCYLENNPCNTDLQNSLTKFKGKSFLFTNFEKSLLDDNILDSIYVLNKIEKKFPNTVDLYFNQEQVEYALKVIDTEKYIGKSGLELSKPNTTDNILNIIWQSNKLVFENDKVVNKYHQLFLSSAQTIYQMNNLNKQLELVWISDEEIFLEIPNKPRFIFDSQTLETQLKKVDTILNARELDEIEKQIVEIDMRFELPVLRTGQ